MGMIPPAPSFFNLVRNYNPYTEYTMPQLREIFGEYGDEVLDQFKRYYKAKNSNNPVQKLGEFFASLDGELAGISDAGIVSGWINFFKSQSQNVKDRAISIVGSPRFLNRNFPPPLNQLVTAENIYSDNVRPAMIDPNPKIPHLISTGMDLPGYISNNLLYAGQVLGEIFNSNIAIVSSRTTKNDLPHQGNLVPDSKHPDRITAAATNFLKNAINYFGPAASFMAKNLGFNKYGVQNKNISSPNYNLNAKTAENQEIKVKATGVPDTKDVASLKRYKPAPTV